MSDEQRVFGRRMLLISPRKEDACLESDGRAPELGEQGRLDTHGLDIGRVCALATAPGSLGRSMKPSEWRRMRMTERPTKCAHVFPFAVPTS